MLVRVYSKTVPRMFQVQVADLHGQRLEAGCAPTGNHKTRRKRSGPPSGCLTLPHRKAGEDANEYGVLSAPD